jgi:hypothetical protein
MLTKKQIKAEAIDVAGEMIEAAGEKECDIYNVGGLPEELMEHIIAQDDVGEDFERQVNIVLAKH